MYAFYEQQRFCDVKLLFNNGKKSIKTHKIILSSCSDYFNVMFNNNFIENIIDEINIYIDIENDKSLDEVIKFMYLKKFNYNINNYKILKEMIFLANYFIMDNLVNLCIVSIIKFVNVDNCIEIYKFSQYYGYKKLLSYTYDYIRSYIELIYNQNEFATLTINDIMKLISDRKTIVASENSVVEILVRWLTSQNSISCFEICKILKLIKIPFVTEEYFNKLQYHPKILYDEKCRKILRVKRNNNSNITPRASTLGSIIYISNPNDHSGGNPIFMTIYTYNFVTNEIKAIDNIHYANNFCSIFYNNIFYFINFSYRVKNSLVHDDFQSYNIITKEWGKIPKISDRKDFSIIIFNEKLYAIGGIKNGSVVSDVSFWDLKSSKWEDAPPLIFPKSNMSLANNNEYIFAIGGKNHELLNNVERFNINDLKWDNVAPLPIPLYNSSAISYKKYIYVIGGKTYTDLPEHYNIDPVDGSSKNLFMYNIEYNVWNELNMMVFTKVLPSLAIINNKIYVVGGDKNNLIEVYDMKKNYWYIFKKSFPKSISKQENIFTNKVFL
ncbi:kelch-like protein [Sheeppox virus]|uniref:Kelch-like protein n=2 Tax=Sheeppox virus TaxID=10266 RepID=A0A3F2YKU7_SHEVT|nr:kelch-like protein [Sheeppox virus]AOE46511.1 kelch-like protein [Sheeppox virus]AOE46660.1 kelch-like protein [Sheeppox virus]AWX92135.1 kelch-like protein [Sheeppox virus]AWX92136.1 kelch-like protein [Sheeppox virus]AWX92137.1 kelch-like protein [Sheeppox virus]